MQCPVNGKRARMDLTDDGTMDTTFRCSQCGREFRFNFDGEGSYGSFKVWARQEATSDHEMEGE